MLDMWMLIFSVLEINHTTSKNSVATTKLMLVRQFQILLVVVTVVANKDG